MIHLVVHLPRTTPRPEWVKVNRWRRLTEHVINAELLDRGYSDTAFDLAVFDSHPEASMEVA